MRHDPEHDLERDLRDARRARARAAGRPDVTSPGGIGGWLRRRTTDHWIMFAGGLAIGGFLF